MRRLVSIVRRSSANRVFRGQAGPRICCLSVKIYSFDLLKGNSMRCL